MKLKKIFDKIQKIETKNLILREIQVKDAKDFFEYYTSENICKYLDWNGPKSLEEAEEYIYTWRKGYEENWILPFAIVNKSNDKMIGTIIFSEFIGKRADLGYEICEAYWRKGLMYEALDKLLPIVIREFDLERIQSIVFKDNEASKRLLDKLKFNEEGLLKKYSYHIVSGECIDSYIYALVL